MTPLTTVSGDFQQYDGTVYIFYYRVGYHYRNWGSHGCAMDLLVKGIAKGKVCGIQAELEEGCDFVC